MALLKSGWRLLNPRFAQCTVSVKHSFSDKKTPEPLSLVSVETDSEGVATITMNRQPVNSLNLDLVSELGEALSQLEADQARGLILTSASETVFTSGLDIMEMYKPDKKRLPYFWSVLQDTWLSLYTCSMPSVAAINGHSPAGGCLLALSCEYRVIVPKATIGLNETQLGIMAPTWFQTCMRSVIGTRQTELALTRGSLFSAPEALKLGLVDEIADSKEEALAQAKKFIAQFKNIPRMARTATKLKVRENNIAWMKDNKLDDISHFVDFMTQDDVQSSLKAYMENMSKRKQ